MVPYYDPKPYIITNTKGNMITAKRDEPRKTVTRNSSWFKRVKGHRESESDFDDIKGGDNEVDMESAFTVSTANKVELESTGNDVSNVGDQPVSQESDRPKRNRRPPKWHEDNHDILLKVLEGCSVVPFEKATWPTYMEQCAVATAQEN